ncbi:MAG TPA: hypothetical protein VHN16_15145 [Streptosporangiaceae bacterium]|nr:hypothetical protein [Streptosporangiaceae bacterium]
MPGQVAGEHADQHVAADPVLEPVVDRAQVQVLGLDVPEVALQVREVLIGLAYCAKTTFSITAR